MMCLVLHRERKDGECTEINKFLTVVIPLLNTYNRSLKKLNILNEDLEYKKIFKAKIYTKKCWLRDLKNPRKKPYMIRDNIGRVVVYILRDDIPDQLLDLIESWFQAVRYYYYDEDYYNNKEDNDEDNEDV